VAEVEEAEHLLVNTTRPSPAAPGGGDRGEVGGDAQQRAGADDQAPRVAPIASGCRLILPERCLPR
jgi:hypothetical protein